MSPASIQDKKKKLNLENLSESESEELLEIYPKFFPQVLLHRGSKSTETNFINFTHIKPENVKKVSI